MIQRLSEKTAKNAGEVDRPGARLLAELLGAEAAQRGADATAPIAAVLARSADAVPAAFALFPRPLAAAAAFVEKGRHAPVAREQERLAGVRIARDVLPGRIAVIAPARRRPSHAYPEIRRAVAGHHAHEPPGTLQVGSPAAAQRSSCHLRVRRDLRGRRELRAFGNNLPARRVLGAAGPQPPYRQQNQRPRRNRFRPHRPSPFPPSAVHSPSQSDNVKVFLRPERVPVKRSALRSHVTCRGRGGLVFAPTRTGPCPRQSRQGRSD